MCVCVKGVSVHTNNARTSTVLAKCIVLWCEIIWWLDVADTYKRNRGGKQGWGGGGGGRWEGGGRERGRRGRERGRDRKDYYSIQPITSHTHTHSG